MNIFPTFQITRSLFPQKVTSAAWGIVITLLFTSSQVNASEWRDLFDGESLKGWVSSKDNQQFEVVENTILARSSSKTHFLCSENEYRDFELEFEVKLHDTDLNSGLQIRTRTTRVNTEGVARPSVHGPQVDLGRSPGRSGHIFGQGNGRWFTPQEDLKRNSSLVNGQWNQIRVIANGKRIQTWINGESVADITLDDATDKTYSKGVIALQVHAVKTSKSVRHVAFRRIRIRELVDDKERHNTAEAK